jgi:4-hydroxy-tetrahydrodipicolinate reductase
MGVLTGRPPSGVKITTDVEEFLGNVEVVIDFSIASATAKLLPICAGQHIPMVIGTTGLDPETRAALERAAERVPIVFAPNYSQGVNALYFLAARATELLGPSFDAEIVEIHHKRKVDSPSGTAVRLAEVVSKAKRLDPERSVTHGRSGHVGARPLEEVGVMALRGGDVVGEHTLYLVGEGERIELTHRATDRSIFARGAVRAAHWIVGRPAGLYDMADVMGIPH